MDEAVCGTLKRFPGLKDEYLSMYLAHSSSMTDHHDHLSKAFKDHVYKPLSLIQTWRAKLIRRYGSKACRSLTLDGALGDLCTVDGFLKVLAIYKSGGLLEGIGPDDQGIPECFRVVRDVEGSAARAWSLAPPIKNPIASVRHTSSEREKQNERRHRKLKRVLMEEQPLFKHRQTWLRQEQLPSPAPWPTRQTYAIRVLHPPTWLAWTHCFHASPVRTHKRSWRPR
jgi:hypothetical protein